MSKNIIHFITDGLNLTPKEYSQMLLKLTQISKIEPDEYSLGGCVKELEEKFAKLLGKEKAIFMPTGTLANHLAIRTLAGNKNRVIVPTESHIYNDSGDCLQSLSGLNLIALSSQEKTLDLEKTNLATFSLEDVKKTLKRTLSGRVATQVGVIVIETPVRRLSGQMFDYQELINITRFARENNIKTHLDGARLFIASSYSGISPLEYSSHFDTVYISLYKYFNASGGAVLAGSKSVIENMFHTRRMFGAGIAEVWPYAIVADHYLTGFSEHFNTAKESAEKVFQFLEKHPQFEVKKVFNGTNLYKLKLNGIDAKSFRKSMLNKDVLLRAVSEDFNGFWLCLNESINQISTQELAEKFIL